MKKYIKLSVIVLLFATVSFLGYSISNELKHKKEIAERIKYIPDFSFSTIGGATFTQKDLSKSLPKLFIYFNSECNFCQAEAKQIQENLEKLKDVQLLFVSFEDTEAIKSFAKKYELLNKNNILFLEDSKLLFEEIFDVQSIPYMLLYSKDGKLLQKFKGATNIDKVNKAIKNE